MRPERRQHLAGCCAALLFALASAASAEPAQPRAMNAKALIALIESQQLGRAEAILRRNQQRAGNRPAVRYLLGVVLYRRYAYAEAIAELEAAVAARPDQWTWQQTLARALSEAGRCSEALLVLARAQAISDDGSLLLDQARCELEGGALQSAADTLHRASQIKPQPSDTAAMLGRVLLELGDSGAALPWLRGALAREPQDLDTRLRLTQALVDLDQSEEAKSNARAVLERSPQHAQALYQMMLLLRQGGETAAAEQIASRFSAALALAERIEHLRQYLAVNPRSAEQQRELGGLLLARGEHAESIRALRQALVLVPGDREALRLMIEAQARAGQTGEAQRLRTQLAALENPP